MLTVWGRGQDSDEEKWPYFLERGRFDAFLANPEACEQDWGEEYQAVLDGLETLRAKGAVRRSPYLPTVLSAVGAME